MNALLVILCVIAACAFLSVCAVIWTAGFPAVAIVLFGIVVGKFVS